MTRFHKYFRYASLDELRSEVDRLLLDITFEDDCAALMQPAVIGTRVIGNRYAIHPMEGCDGTPDGAPGDLTIRRWHRFAAGGAKLLWGEATAVTSDGRANPRQLMITPQTITALAELLASTKRVHRERFGRDDDFLVGLQLTHSGRWSCDGPIIAYHHPTVDRRTFRDASRKSAIDAGWPLVSDAELEHLIERYLEAIGLAARAGFDFVDIKQCHTYLLSELLSATSREGRFGGTQEGRFRFVRTLIDEARSAHPDIILASRINAYDGVPFRTDPETGVGTPDIADGLQYQGFGVSPDDPLTPDLTEPLALVGMMLDRGVRLVNVSLGSPYYNPHMGRPYDRPHDGGYLTPEHPLVGVDRHFALTAAIQQAYPDVLTVGTGYSWLQKYCIHAGASNIRRGRTAFMGLGRGALAYPDFAADAIEHGALDSKRVCLSVSFCTDLMREKRYELGQAPTGCVPRDDVYSSIYKSIKAKTAT